MWHLWNDLLSQQDRAVIKAAGYDRRGAASWDSRSRGRQPAVLVIDMQRLLVGQDVPILEAVQEYRTAMGEIAWRAVPPIQTLLTTARQVSVPVLYTRVIPRQYQPDDEAVQLIKPLAPRAGDVIIDKRHSSAFHETRLWSQLAQHDVDTLILAGNSTSGCIRATAVDALQHGLSPVVPVECVFDRIQVSHRVGLLDLWMKYALVQPLADTLAYLENLPERKPAQSTSKTEG